MSAFNPQVVRFFVRGYRARSPNTALMTGDATGGLLRVNAKRVKTTIEDIAPTLNRRALLYEHLCESSAREVLHVSSLYCRGIRLLARYRAENQDGRGVQTDTFSYASRATPVAVLDYIVDEKNKKKKEKRAGKVINEAAVRYSRRSQLRRGSRCS